MIIEKLERADALAPLSPRIGRALRYLRERDIVNGAPGKYDLDGSDILAIVQQGPTKLPDTCFWEAHRRYLDIQLVTEGVERMGWAPLESLTQRGPYDEQKDLIILDGTGDFITVHAGTLVIFFPHDAHMPSVAVNEPQIVRKTVVKVRVG
jgi:YhcH/YjgK/YiaL family protein